MGALDAFYTTWSQARTTFGAGAPKTGDEFDGSERLRQMQSTIESAAPDDRWQGTASQAYAAKNAEHAAVYGKLADLDQRMAAEISRAAEVVNSGRQNLEQTQSWVQSMAAALPGGQSGETMRMILARRGLSQVSDTVQQSTEEMGAIGERVRALGRVYEETAGSHPPKNRADVSKLNSPTYTDDGDITSAPTSTSGAIRGASFARPRLP
ncbi:EspA/EspE family type VII secretion system effector [Mycolicibacterium houstonense]|uniref:EspA/EspE family type VII secretion system effector n=1 Tax=Mycolicibacterium houstonense TaxID=146021 RepID=UPI000ABDEE47|nr:EspA/EspE family type VII secretion system effector [Mycolicibacterium houstonense]